MKKIITSVLVLFMGLTMSAETYCLKLTEVSNDGEFIVVKIAMQGDIPFKLGTSNLQFEFNTEAIGEPVLQESVMAPPVYFVPTVTLPFENICSFNVELGFPDTGMEIAGYPNWTDLGEVRFAVVNSSVETSYEWAYNGGTTETVAFLDDEATFFFASDVSADCLIVETLTGIDEVTSTFFQELNVYPNPASDVISVAYDLQESSEVRFTIYDALGKLVQEGVEVQNSGEQKLTFNTQEYSAGQYVLTLIVDENIVTKRFDVVK